MNGKASWMSVMRESALSIGPEAGDQAKGGSGEQGDPGTGQADEQGHPRAVDEPAQDIAADLVGPEQAPRAPAGRPAWRKQAIHDVAVGGIVGRDQVGAKGGRDDRPQHHEGAQGQPVPPEASKRPPPARS
jgi:hypothetical protein